MFSIIWIVSLPGGFSSTTCSWNCKSSQNTVTVEWCMTEFSLFFPTGCKEVSWEQEDHVMLWTSGKHTICGWIVRESPSLKSTHCAAAYLSVKTFLNLHESLISVDRCFLLSSSWSLVLSNGLLGAEVLVSSISLYIWCTFIKTNLSVSEKCFISPLKSLWDHGFLKFFHQPAEGDLELHIRFKKRKTNIPTFLFVVLFKERICMSWKKEK